ncbi:hypothetical protein ACQ4PT_002096 [Festuca glaucescens]
MARMANELGDAGDNKGVSRIELLNAAEELTQADGTRRAEGCLCAIDLALAGRCFLRVAAFGSTEGPAAGQPNHPVEQITGGGHAAWWVRKTKVGDLEEYLLQKTSPASSTSVAAASSSKQSKGSKSDNWAGIHLFCLGGSLSLLPYLGKDGLLIDKEFSDDYRWGVSFLLMLWWCLVSFGVTCSLFGRSSFELQYARFSSYLGMFGISALVMMFLHWALAIDSMRLFYYVLAGAALIFLAHLIWV